MELPRATWQELGRAAGDSDRFGHKADRLARAAVRFPVVPGWVLDTAGAAALDHPTALRLTHELIELHPTRRWILRSSSPFEDTAQSTAAGLFATLSADAVPEALLDALMQVVRSAADPRLPAILAPDQRNGPLPIAVLAQPHLEFHRWCTVEARTEGTLLEGWSMDRHGVAEPVRCLLESCPPQWNAVRSLAERLRAESEQLPILMELGEDTAQQTWLLQVRSAPRAAPSWTRPDDAEPPQAIPSVVGLGSHVHPGDDVTTWVWDLEHCPTALCPLLAGLFGPWIAADPSSPSRLIHGRWHDRAPSDATREPAELTLGAVDRMLESWREHEARSLRPPLEALRARVATVWTREEAPLAWQSFTNAWLEWQRAYFDVPSGPLRRWARKAAEKDAQLAPRSLGPTVAGERAQRWTSLAARLKAHPAAPPAQAQSLQAWALAHADDDLARELARELERCGHLCTWAFDGRGIPWEFAPMPFWRAIAMRMQRTPSAPREAATDALDPRTERMRAILARAEDDDDLLLIAYRHWHGALRRIAEAAGDEAPTRMSDLLELLPDDLLAWMHDHDRARFAAAFTRGRALARAWDAHGPRIGSSAEAAPTDRARGIAAAPGRFEGVVRRANHLGELEEAGRGEAVVAADLVVAVVATIGPADAVHIGGLGGLVCEGGDVLGHASVLAREYGVPCVVGVANARLRFAHAERLLVDGDRGEAVVTARRR